MDNSSNSIYSALEMEDGAYRCPEKTDYPTDNPFRKLVKVKPIRKLVFDENYEYLDRKGFKYKINHAISLVGAMTICRLVNYIRFGLVTKGRENLKKNQKFFKDGVITISNHVYRFDALAIAGACRYRETWIPVYGDQMMTKDYWNIRYFCTVPLPTTMSGMRKFNAAFDTLAAEKKWFHIFPESCRWDMYQPIRPFRKGAFTMAYKYNRPVVPCAFSYRPRTGFWKLFGNKETPLVQLNIGEPIFPDKSRPRMEEVERLRSQCHAAMVKLAGIRHNPWPAAMDDVQGENTI